MTHNTNLSNPTYLSRVIVICCVTCRLLPTNYLYCFWQKVNILLTLAKIWYFQLSRNFEMETCFIFHFQSSQQVKKRIFCLFCSGVGEGGVGGTHMLRRIGICHNLGSNLVCCAKIAKKWVLFKEKSLSMGTHLWKKITPEHGYGS